MTLSMTTCDVLEVPLTRQVMLRYDSLSYVRWTQHDNRRVSVWQDKQVGRRR